MAYLVCNTCHVLELGASGMVSLLVLLLVMLYMCVEVTAFLSRV
jgi:hypothetical protein